MCSSRSGIAGDVQQQPGFDGLFRRCLRNSGYRTYLFIFPIPDPCRIAALLGKEGGRKNDCQQFFKRGNTARRLRPGGCIFL